MRRWIPAGLLSIVLVAINAPATIAGGATLLVDDDGHASGRSCSGSGPAYATIRDAIEDLDDSDTILVCPGTYTGRLDLSGFYEVDLVARGSGPAVILAPSRDIDMLVDLGTVVIGSDSNSITGFTLKARGGTSGCGRVDTMIRGEGSMSIVDNVITVQGSPTWGPCGYQTGISVGGLDDIIQDNTIRDWRKAGISTGLGAVVLGNKLHFAHVTGTTCSGGLGSVPVCGGATAIELYQFDGSVLLNEIAPGTSFTPGGYVGTGIDIDDPFASEGDSFVVDNEIRRANTGIRLRSSPEAQSIEIYDNTMRFGTYGLRVDAGHAADVVDIHDNVSTDHTFWDCYDAHAAEHAWTSNVGLRDSPESICIDP